MENLNIFIVGGWVRDRILGRDPSDRDYVAVGHDPEDMEAAGLQPVDANRFPVFLNDDGDEVALARTEQNTGEGYHGFETFTDDVSLHDDLARRDFTINSIAYDPSTGSYHYPVAVDDGERHIHPIKDIQDRVLRHTSSAFEEDPLRVVRLARFAARFPSFTIADETIERARAVAPEVDHLPHERWGDEVRKAMKQAGEPRRFFDVLRTVGALDIIMPEVADLIDVPPGGGTYHKEGDAYEHTMMVLTEMYELRGNDIPALLMALAHDLGKGATPESKLPHHPAHDRRGASVANALGRRLRLPNELRKAMRDASKQHMRVHNVHPGSEHTMRANKVLKLVGSIQRGTGADIDRLLDLAKADSRGRIPAQDIDTDPIRERLELAKHTTETVDAAYAMDKRDGDLEDYDGEAIGNMIQQDRVEYFREHV